MTFKELPESELPTFKEAREAVTTLMDDFIHAESRKTFGSERRFHDQADRDFAWAEACRHTIDTLMHRVMILEYASKNHQSLIIQLLGVVIKLANLEEKPNE